MVQISQNPIGQSPAWLATLDTISELAAIDKPVLVVGERGVGKTLVCGRLHFLSPRWEENFIRLDCAALPEEALCAEVFGAPQPGAYGATTALERAEGGSLYLANIDQTSLRFQHRLVALLENGHYMPFGADEDIAVNIRLIMSTSRDLQSLTAQGVFLPTLLDLISFDVITLPPLRNRAGDIAVLSQHFAKQMVKVLGEEKFAGFAAEALQSLDAYSWPGNIRELKTVVERAVGRAWNSDQGLTRPIGAIDFDPFASPWPLADKAPPRPDTLAARHAGTTVPEVNLLEGTLAEGKLVEGKLPDAKSSEMAAAGFTERVRLFERRLIDEALQAGGHHQGKAAKYMGLSYHQFRGLLRKHGLKR